LRIADRRLSDSLGDRGLGDCGIGSIGALGHWGIGASTRRVRSARPARSPAFGGLPRRVQDGADLSGLLQQALDPDGLADPLIGEAVQPPPASSDSSNAIDNFAMKPGFDCARQAAR
jgi:hypothetical protein